MLQGGTERFGPHVFTALLSGYPEPQSWSSGPCVEEADEASNKDAAYWGGPPPPPPSDVGPGLEGLT